MLLAAAESGGAPAGEPVTCADFGDEDTGGGGVFHGGKDGGVLGTSMSAAVGGAWFKARALRGGDETGVGQHRGKQDERFFSGCVNGMSSA